MLRISDAERRNRLAIRHGLAAPFATVAEVADALVGLHSSDPATVFLSLRARMEGITIEDIESALYDRAELWRIWSMRRTMFMVPPDLASIMYAAATRDVVADERRKLLKMFRANNATIDAEEWLERVAGACMVYLEEVGTATTAEMKKNVDGLDIKLTVRQGTGPEVTTSLASRLLMLLAMDGRVAKGRPTGTWRSSQYEWLSLQAWAGESLADVSTTDAETQLVSRWLAAYGPGSFEDIKWWTGWTVAKTRRALELVGAEEVVLECGTGFILPNDSGQVPDPEPWVALLPGLDPSVMGWKERGWILGDLAGWLFDRNGNAGPTAWANGEIVGGWAQRPDGSIAVGILRDPGAEARVSLNLEAARLSDWMGPVNLRSRFPSPYEKQLRNG